MDGNIGGVILIKMTNVYTMPNLTGGIDTNIIQIVKQVPSFTIGLLVFVWGVVFLGGTSTQSARKGYADMPMWATMASLSTLIVTLILSITAGLMDIVTFGVVVAVTIMSGLWLFLSKGRGEF